MIFEYIYYLMVVCTLSSYAGAIDDLEVISKIDIVGFSSQNADPCDSYTEIDDPTRNPNYGFGYLCDETLTKGWYRFVGSGGNIIPTSCVDVYQCNTDIPLWMNGTLPELEDGEVNRTVCASWMGGCCDSSIDPYISDLRVKKCKDGYYVYNLVPPKGCYVRYCTDFINVPASTISSIPITTGRSVTNAQMTTKEFNPELEKSLECTEDDIELAIKVPSMSSVTPYAYFDDQSCVGRFNGTHIIMTTGLNQCDTKIKFPSSTDVTYSNNVWYMEAESDGSIVSRTGEVKILVECTYSRDKTLSFGSFAPNYNLHETSVQGFGEITFSMSMYKANNFAESYAAGDYPVQVDVGQTLYVGLSAHSSTPDLELLIADCKASTSANPLEESNSVFNYPLIQTGCPADNTVVYMASNGTFSKQFSFEAFVFHNRSPEVFLHCEAVLCSLTDQQSCDLDCPNQTRKRRSTSHIDNAERNFITIGPIHWVQ